LYYFDISFVNRDDTKLNISIEMYRNIWFCVSSLFWAACIYLYQLAILFNFMWLITGALPHLKKWRSVRSLNGWIFWHAPPFNFIIFPLNYPYLRSFLFKETLWLCTLIWINLQKLVKMMPFKISICLIFILFCPNIVVLVI